LILQADAVAGCQERGNQVHRPCAVFGKEKVTVVACHVDNARRVGCGKVRVGQVNTFNEELANWSDWSDPSAAAWLGEQGVSHIYVGPKGGQFEPASLAQNPSVRLLFFQDGVFLREGVNPVVIENAQTDKRIQYREEKVREGIASILSVPIKARDEVIGALRLYTAKTRHFTEDEILLTNALAHQGGLAILNTSCFISLEKDMKDLKDDMWSHRSWF